MVHYRRFKIKGGIYFFTVTLQDRSSTALIDHIDLLGNAMRCTRAQMPYSTKAIVVLPEHIHAVWALPEGDSNFSYRWMKIKYHFTRSILKRGVSLQKNERGEYNLWQNRFWEHLIRNENDYINHVNYIHYNPVKHKLVRRVRDWPHSSFHHFVSEGILSENWCDRSPPNINLEIE